MTTNNRTDQALDTLVKLLDSTSDGTRLAAAQTLLAYSDKKGPSDADEQK